MPFVETQTGRLHYEVCDVVAPWVSSPQTILFHHGIAANVHIWSAWLPVLISRFRLVRFDMRGFGESVQPARDFHWSFDVLCDDLRAVANASGADRFHLVGESIGGTVAIAFASRHPERVLSLALSNAAARGGLVSNVTGWRELMARDGQAAWAAELMRSRFYPDSLAPHVDAWYRRLHETCSMDATLALADLLLASDLTPALAHIRVPTLLMSPDASPFIPLDVMVAMRATIPEAELQVFAHAKHGLPLSHGSRCARVLRDFLERRCA